MMRMRVEIRLKALERRIIVKPLPPLVVSCEAADGSTELCWIGWFENGVGKSWSRDDGIEVPEALKAQLGPDYSEFCRSVGRK